MGDIREMSTNDQNYKPLISDARTVRSIAVHVETEMIYWTGLTKKKIYRASMSTGKIEVVLDSKTNKPSSLAIDWVGHKLFWIDRCKFVFIKLTIVDNRDNKPNLPLFR